MTTISALLLPLGIWLILSAATPKTDENRVAVSGLLTAIVSALAFAAIGFAFMAERGLAFTLSGQAWEVLGSTGFLMSGPASALSRLVPNLALAVACALLVNGVIARRANHWCQAAVSALVGGVLFPVAGKWVLGNGWLAMLGRHLNFGHGAIDFGGLSTAGLVAGVVGLVLAWVLPRKPANLSASLPLAQFPIRAVSGAACLLIGAVVVFGANLPPGEPADKVISNYLTTLSMACGMAGLCGLLYSRVTSPHAQADVLCATRAGLAAAIMVSSGAVALPIWLAASLGIVAGLLATIGLYVVQEKLQLDDPSALVTTALIPGVVGFLATGLFANGNLGAGWHGVGATSYLATPQLGVVGLLPTAAPLGDPGQFTAQLIAIGSIGAVSLLGAGVIAHALRPQLQRQFATTPVVEETSPAVVPQLAEPVLPIKVIEIQPILPTSAEPAPSAPPVIESVGASAVAPVIVPDHKEVSALPTPEQPAAETKRVVVTVPQSTEKPADKRKADDSLLDKLRRLRRANLPEQPARARKVAYPTRVSGKRLIRPLVEEPATKR